MSDTVAISASSLDMSAHSVNLAEVIDSKIHPDFFKPVEVVKINEHGTENIEKLFDKVSKIVSTGIENLGDGWQIWDTWHIGVIVKDIISARGILKDAIPEFTDHITEKEKAKISTSFIQNGLKFVKSLPKKGQDKYGINSTKLVFNTFFDSIDTICDALDDGLQWRDFSALSSVTGGIIAVVPHVRKTRIELRDLTDEEIIILFSTVAVRVWGLIERFTEKN